MIGVQFIHKHRHRRVYIATIWSQDDPVDPIPDRLTAHGCWMAVRVPTSLRDGGRQSRPTRARIPSVLCGLRIYSTMSDTQRPLVRSCGDAKWTPQPRSRVPTGGRPPSHHSPLCVLKVGAVGRYLWIDLNEYSLEPQKVAKDSQTTNFGDGVKTYFLSNSQVLKQLL